MQYLSRMDPSNLTPQQVALLLKTMGLGVQRDLGQRRSHGASDAQPSPLVAGLGLLMILLMIMRTPGVAGAVLDLVQVIRMIAVAAMCVSGFVLVSKLCAEPRRPQPLQQSAAFPMELPGRRYAIVAISDGDSEDRNIGPHDAGREARDEDLEIASEDDTSSSLSGEMGSNENT